MTSSQQQQQVMTLPCFDSADDHQNRMLTRAIIDSLLRSHRDRTCCGRAALIGCERYASVSSRVCAQRTVSGRGDTRKVCVRCASTCARPTHSSACSTFHTACTCAVSHLIQKHNTVQTSHDVLKSGQIIMVLCFIYFNYSLIVQILTISVVVNAKSLNKSYDVH